MPPRPIGPILVGWRFKPSSCRQSGTFASLKAAANFSYLSARIVTCCTTGCPSAALASSASTACTASRIIGCVSCGAAGGVSTAGTGAGACAPAKPAASKAAPQSSFFIDHYPVSSQESLYQHSRARQDGKRSADSTQAQVQYGLDNDRPRPRTRC